LKTAILPKRAHELIPFKQFDEKLIKASLAAAGPKADDPAKTAKDHLAVAKEQSRYLRLMAEARRIAGTVTATAG
jgi:hypothetical protein